MPETPEQWQDGYEENEAQRVRRWRILTARHAGLTLPEARSFADGDGDLARLRAAAEHGATHDELVHIFL